MRRADHAYLFGSMNLRAAAMKAITITREYGAGGGEVAGKLAARLGWELLDRELLHQAAQIEHVPDADLERLDEKTISIADRFHLHPPHQKYLHGLTAAARQAAQRGNVVLVGRGARQLLGEMPDAFHLRLVAPRESRAERMANLEGWSLEQARAVSRNGPCPRAILAVLLWRCSSATGEV